MNKTPKVSVVIPSYNCAPYLPETVESVLAQTYTDFELIVVDDGSTDETLEVLKPYENRIRLHSQANRGASAARNSGVKIATGELVAFLDADDVWLPEKLAMQVKVFEREPDIGVCFTNYLEFGDADEEHGFDEGGGKLYRIPRRAIGDDAYVITSPSLFEEFLLYGANPCWTSTVVVRRKCLDLVGLFDERYVKPSVEDTQLWLRLAKYFPFGYVDRILAKRRVRKARYYVNPDEHYQNIFSTTTHMLENLHRWIPLSERECRALHRRIAQYRFAWGYFEFSRYCLEAARANLQASLRAAFSWKALYYFVLTFLPISGLRLLRSLKHMMAS